MNKPVLIALAILVSTFSFAQKKELRAAEKAINSANYAEAKAALSQAEQMLSIMDDKQKAEFKLLKAQALYANGTGSNDDFNESIKFLNEVDNQYTAETVELRKSMENAFLTEANDLYKANNFTMAANRFEQLYRVMPNDTTYLYYAAVSAVSGQDYESALNYYLKLDDLGYTGVEKEYYAFNVEKNEEEVLDKATRDIYIKAGTHIKPGERLTESKSAEIVKNIALIYVNLDRKDDAIAAIRKARTNEPNDVNLILTEANLQYKMGNTAEYKKLIEQATTIDPTNIDLFYNLGVLSAEAGDKEAAKKYYDKVIQMDKTYVNAQTNMAALILEEEQAIIEEMNGLGSSSADNKRYDELKEKRIQVYKSAIPYLESVMEIEPNNVQAAKTLMNIYSAIDDMPKFKAMKAKVEALGG